MKLKLLLVTLILGGVTTISYAESNPKKEDYKWSTPTPKICEDNGGSFRAFTCQAKRSKAKQICRLSGGRLPSINELKEVVTHCTGIILDTTKDGKGYKDFTKDRKANSENVVYQDCIKRKGFYDGHSKSKEYISSTPYASSAPKSSQLGRTPTLMTLHFSNARLSPGGNSTSNLIRCVMNEDESEPKKEESKWITPTPKICKANHGSIRDSNCMADRSDAKEICRVSGGKLASLDDLKKVMIGCGGIISFHKERDKDAIFANETNSVYQNCYKRQGFYSKRFCSSTLSINKYPNPKRLSVNFSKGTISTGYVSQTFVRCIKE